jgi:hypothetical protein
VTSAAGTPSAHASRARRSTRPHSPLGSGARAREAHERLMPISTTPPDGAYAQDRSRRTSARARCARRATPARHDREDHRARGGQPLCMAHGEHCAKLGSDAGRLAGSHRNGKTRRAHAPKRTTSDAGRSLERETAVAIGPTRACGTRRASWPVAEHPQLLERVALSISPVCCRRGRAATRGPRGRTPGTGQAPRDGGPGGPRMHAWSYHAPGGSAILDSRGLHDRRDEHRLAAQELRMKRCVSVLRERERHRAHHRQPASPRDDALRYRINR